MNRILKLVALGMMLVNLFLPDTIGSLKGMLIWAAFYIIAEIQENKDVVNLTIDVNGKIEEKEEEKKDD